MRAELTDEPEIGKPFRSYRTMFERDENPISEGGMWINGKKEGIDWADVVTESGIAHGGPTKMAIPEHPAEQVDLDGSTLESALPAGHYDDPTALLAGSWGKNQHAKGKVFSRNQTEEYFQEVELRLRSTLAPKSCTGYEVLWRCLKTERAYMGIVRWNEKIRDFTSLADKRGPAYGVKDGDVVEATIVGNVIKAYINGVEVLSATDDTYDAGSPGIGFDFGCADTYVDHGFSYYEVDTYDD